jgi:hypothetical protein
MPQGHCKPYRRNYYMRDLGHIHFVGIGGMGMSALARPLHAGDRGWRVTIIIITSLGKSWKMRVFQFIIMMIMTSYRGFGILEKALVVIRQLCRIWWNGSLFAKAEFHHQTRSSWMISWPVTAIAGRMENDYQHRLAHFTIQQRYQNDRFLGRNTWRLIKLELATLVLMWWLWGRWVWSFVPQLEPDPCWNNGSDHLASMAARRGLSRNI